jgi:hypothetical protein
MVALVIFGVILLLIAIYVGFKILKNLIIGLILLIMIVLACFLIFGSISSLRAIPFIGRLIPKIPTTPQGVIIAIKDILYSIDVAGVDKDSHDNLLIAVANTGKLEVSNISVFVDNQTVNITNSIKDPLKSGEITIIQTNWNEDFSEILVQTKQANATYKPE